MQNPKISVLMPVYNANEDWLKEAIESVLNQTFANFEFIIINDGSTNNTEDIILSYKDDRIHYIKQENLGIASSLNKGLSVAKGEYIARMDADDISLPERFEKQVKFLDQNQDISIVGTYYEYFPIYSLIKVPLFPCYLDFLKACSLCHPSVMFRKKDFDRYNLKYNPDYACEDYELWSRAICCLKIANIAEVLLKYRRHGDNATNNPKVWVDDSKVKQNMLDFLTDDKELQQKIKDNIFTCKKPKKTFLWKVCSKIRNTIRKFNNVRIVRLMGGLGNQMFQYAFGKSLEKATGEKVIYDISWFDEAQKLAISEMSENSSSIVMRKFNLDIFNINIPFATSKDLTLCQNQIFEKNEFEFDKNLLKNRKSVIYTGYFQHEEYLKNIKDELKKDFTFPEIKQSDKFNQYWLNKIKSCENPVFIHIRRGDYVNLGWDLQTDYYKKAIEYIKQHINNPTFFIFGQNCKDYIEDELSCLLNLKSQNVNIIGDENSTNKEDWKDIVLMSECKHAIIANSTFSWWAAWLGNANNGTVIAPSPFVNGTDGIICKNWVKIKRK